MVLLKTILLSIDGLKTGREEMARRREVWLRVRMQVRMEELGYEVGFEVEFESVLLFLLVHPRSVAAASQFSAADFVDPGLAVPDWAMKPLTIGSCVHANE